jgi:hypothetical protein
MSRCATLTMMAGVLPLRGVSHSRRSSETTWRQLANEQRVERDREMAPVVGRHELVHRQRPDALDGRRRQVLAELTCGDRADTFLR